MDRMVAFCGMVCTECPAFIATQNDDDEARRRTVDLWKKQFNVDLKPEDINCKEGCLSDGEDKFGHCKVCQIRQCSIEKRLENCARCDEYACDILSAFLEKAPEAKAALDEIRSRL